jgi:hypothetical protein
MRRRLDDEGGAGGATALRGEAGRAEGVALRPQTGDSRLHRARRGASTGIGGGKGGRTTDMELRTLDPPSTRREAG